MKRLFIKALFVLLLAIIYVTFVSVSTFAMNVGFSTEEFSPEEHQRRMARINIEFSKEPPGRRTIECFDVNEKGMIALGYNKFGSTSTICVFSSNGEFQYCYEYENSGSFTFEWDGDNLVIWDIRSGSAKSVDPSGKVLELRDVPSTYENTKYYRTHLLSPERYVGNVKYELRNDLGLLNLFAVQTYSQLVVIDEDGVEHVIYDASTTQIFKCIGFIIFIIVFCSGFIYVIRGFIARVKASDQGKATQHVDSQ